MIDADQANEFIIEALKFGNRAVAHLEAGYVDHNFRTAADDVRLVEAIDYTEAKVIQVPYTSHVKSICVQWGCRTTICIEDVLI